MLSVWGRCTNWWNIGQPTFLWRWGQEVAGAGAAPQPPLSGATQPGMTMTMTMTSCSFCSSSVGIRKLKEMYWWGLWGRKHQESFPLHTKDTFQIETQKPLGQEVSEDICQYLLYHLRMYFLYPGRVSVHTIVYLVYTNTLHNPVPALDTVPAPVAMTKNIIHRPHNSSHCQLQAAGVRGSDSGYPDQITQYPAQTFTAHYWESCEWYLERDYDRADF